jgi:hypothetical protein
VCRGGFQKPVISSGPRTRHTHIQGVPLPSTAVGDKQNQLMKAKRSKNHVGSLDFDPVDPAAPGEVTGVYEPNDDALDTEESIIAEKTEGPPLVPEDPDDRNTYAKEQIAYLRNRGLLYDYDGVRLNQPHAGTLSAVLMEECGFAERTHSTRSAASPRKIGYSPTAAASRLAATTPSSTSATGREVKPVTFKNRHLLACR